jgi:bifunctional non-homologous end joining protein LigD
MVAPIRRLKFIEPMKAAVAPAPPYNGQWLYEVKFDGFRVLAVKNGRDVELWSRNRKRLDERFPEVIKAIAQLSVKSCILDGEVCALNEQGRSSFQLLHLKRKLLARPAERAWLRSKAALDALYEFDPFVKD